MELRNGDYAKLKEVSVGQGRVKVENDELCG
jgi:hypothetical protein